MKRIITLLILSTLCTSAFTREKGPSKFCLSSKEFITTVIYLRSKKDFGLDEKSILKISDTVSRGCTNASDRFVKIMKVLTKIGIDTKSSLETAMEFSHKTDEHTQAFIEIFKYSYNPDKMDLDILASMKVALKLSLNFDGDVKIALKNYKKLVSFCLDHKNLGISSSQCAKLSQEIVSMGKGHQKLLASKFIRLVRFLQKSKKGPKLPLLKAISKAKVIIGMGESAEKNFIQAFKFASSKKGLAYSDLKAMDLAEKLASRSTKTDKLVKVQK